jgi:hypothetical protein
MVVTTLTKKELAELFRLTTGEMVRVYETEKDEERVDFLLNMSNKLEQYA